MALLLDFTEAENVRNELTEEQKEAIENLFVKLSKDIQKQAEKAPRVPSDALRKQYLYALQKQVDKAVDGFRHDIQGIIEGNMEKTAEAVAGCNLDFLQAIGMPIEGAFSHVPVDTVISVATGQLYEGNWTLARQLWKQSVHTQKDVNTVIANGIAANKSAYDIAKDLEKYVNPKARKEWDWSKVYPGTSKKVDYNAQRLARTMVSHAYQQAFVKTTQKNPFVTEYEWQASNSERTCEICEERDGQHYAKDDLPLDHPNGMCTFVAVMPDDMEAIADRLADWANGKEDPELDAWAQTMYGPGWDTKKSEAAVKPASVLDRVTGLSKIGDINKVVNDSGWFTDKVYFQGSSIETVQHIVSAYQKIFDRYPQLVGQFPAPRIGVTENPKAYASCATATTGQITLNKAKWGTWDSLASAYARDVRMGFHPEGTTAESLITHEFGHALDGWLARSGKVKTDTEYASSVMIERAFDRSGMSTSTVGWKVSSYAKKNDRECFAECFVQGMYSEDPCSLTKEFMKNLDGVLGGT